MILAEELCLKCGKVNPTVQEPHLFVIFWRCSVCGSIVDSDFTDDGIALMDLVDSEAQAEQTSGLPRLPDSDSLQPAKRLVE